MAEKFCFCLSLRTGCLLLGITTFITALTKLTLGIMFAIMESQLTGPRKPSRMLSIEDKYKSTVDIVVILWLTITGMWMAVSVTFIYGVLKKKAGQILLYFLFGIVMCILLLISALLEIIQGLWVPSLVTCILTLLYFKCLLSVYTLYNQTQEEKPSDEQLLVDDDFSIDLLED